MANNSTRFFNRINCTNKERMLIKNTSRGNSSRSNSFRKKRATLKQKKNTPSTHKCWLHVYIGHKSVGLHIQIFPSIRHHTFHAYRCIPRDHTRQIKRQNYVIRTWLKIEKNNVQGSRTREQRTAFHNIQRHIDMSSWHSRLVPRSTGNTIVPCIDSTRPNIL